MPGRFFGMHMLEVQVLDAALRLTTVQIMNTISSVLSRNKH